MQRDFPNVMAGFWDPGLFLNDKTGKEFTSSLADLLRGTTDDFPLPLTQKRMRHLLKIAKCDTFIKPQSMSYHLRALIEVGFMIVRGHCTDLMNPRESDWTACTDGVYINILREVLVFLTSKTDDIILPDIDFIACHT